MSNQTLDNNKSEEYSASLLPNASNSGCVLFASRVVLYKLGVTDCGICDAVG